MSWTVLVVLAPALAGMWFDRAHIASWLKGGAERRGNQRKPVGL